MRTYKHLREMMDERHDIHVLINEVRHKINFEDGERRESLKAQIDRISDAINMVREQDNMDRVLHDTLIKAIQFANKERASNRRRVKQLSNLLKTHKKSLQHINRAISMLENEIVIDV